MANQTAFPGILVESIKVEKPPFDEPGVVQEFVGRGVTREFDDPTKGMNLTPDKIEQIFEDFEDHIGPFRGSFKVRYNLIIRATPAPDMGKMFSPKKFQKRAVSTRARLFVRAKNPFEPNVLQVGEPSIDERMSEEANLNYYRVPVWVTK